MQFSALDFGLEFADPFRFLEIWWITSEKFLGVWKIIMNWS